MSKHLPPFTATQLLHTLKSLPQVNSYIVGFSGGADSSALLFALIELGAQLGKPVSAVHINHGIHADADQWQQHCEDFCRRYAVPLQCIAVKPGYSSGKGLEAEARQLRYAAISALLDTGDCLLTAHHSDDQSETLLLNLMRGSGIDGLSAMPQHRPLGAGSLQRPLLDFQNAGLRRYLRDNNISWLEDPSNQSLNHDRNFMRHEIIPLLESRWPGINQRLALTRMTMAESRILLEPLADAYLGQHLAHRFVLSLTPQLEGNPALFKLVIRRWLKQAAVASIPARSLNTLYTQLGQQQSDHKIAVHWGASCLRVYRQQLWLLAEHLYPACPSLAWPHGQNELDLGEQAGKLVLQGRKPGEWPGQMLIGNRSSNKASSLQRGKHHISLKNLFQSAAIPSWFRDSIPLCFLDGELVAAGDWNLSDNFALWLSENRLDFSWQPGNPLLQFIVASQRAKMDSGDG